MGAPVNSGGARLDGVDKLSSTRDQRLPPMSLGSHQPLLQQLYPKHVHHTLAVQEWFTMNFLKGKGEEVRRTRKGFVYERTY